MPKRRKNRPSTDREISDLVQFAAEIRAGRAVLGWNQTELAKRAVVTQRAIYCIEKTMARPRREIQHRITEALASAGFQFEPLSKGAFKVTASSKAIITSPLVF